MAAAARKTRFQASPSGLQKTFVENRVDFPARTQPVQMRKMPVPRLCFLVFVAPFQQPAVFPDLVVMQPASDLILFKALFIQAQNFSAFDGCRKQFPEYLIIHGRRITQAPLFPIREPVCVFRGYGRIGYQISIRILHQKIHEKVRRAFKNIIVLCKEVPVAPILIMLPDMEAQPGASHRPVGGRYAPILGRGIPPQIGIMVEHKAPAPVHVLCRSPAVFLHFFQVLKQRQM